MRSTHLLFAVVSLASALVIPDEDMVAEIRSQGQLIVDHRGGGGTHDEGIDADSWWAMVDTLKGGQSSRGLFEGEQDWGRGDWPGEGRDHHHEHWPGEGHHHRHGEFPGEGHHHHHHHHHHHGDCPDDDNGGRGSHGHRPPFHPGHGDWPGQDDRPCPRPPNRDQKPPHRIHRPTNPCPGSQCHLDKTILEIIQENERTSRLAELIASDKDLITLLTKGNHTIFAPTNQALAHLDEIPQKLIASFLRYHIVPDRLPIHEIANHATLATHLTSPSLGANLTQRIRVHDVDGVVLNGRSAVIEADTITKTGIIHLIDSALVPPPATLALISPCSTFMQALAISQMTEHFDSARRGGGTTFVPTNAAFRQLGEPANEFLFSEEGRECLALLMGYHVVVNATLYPDVVYTREGKVRGLVGKEREGEMGHAVVRMETVSGREVRVDVKRGQMRVDGFGRVVGELVARDGSVIVLDRVLVPPKKVKGEVEDGEVMVEELVERLKCGREGRGRGEL
ncbi:uncharacterized protein N7529_005160 [Penicillium soppii]|uniref:uncharacterized protein n=1 Tax=Penicillium soppii TaxID=69789 RepID=UPI0025480F20|nr:uncharacterized protein N7529_005160 [Penicillium soppii]KAJ5872807.1 hypothetical protein N7529_005160 [Penicillium soppii]